MPAWRLRTTTTTKRTSVAGAGTCARRVATAVRGAHWLRAGAAPQVGVEAMALVRKQPCQQSWKAPWRAAAAEPAGRCGATKAARAHWMCSRERRQGPGPTAARAHTNEVEGSKSTVVNGSRTQSSHQNKQQRPTETARGAEKSFTKNNNNNKETKKNEQVETLLFASHASRGRFRMEIVWQIGDIWFQRSADGLLSIRNAFVLVRARHHWQINRSNTCNVSGAPVPALRMESEAQTLQMDDQQLKSTLISIRLRRSDESTDHGLR